MIKIASLVYDVYTDVHKQDLMKMASSMPDYVKDAELISEDQLDNLSDGDFALIFNTREGETLRLFPILNKAHTWLAVQYFVRNKSKLPEEAQKIAATNILNAASFWEVFYDLDESDLDILRNLKKTNLTARRYKAEEGEKLPDLKESYSKVAQSNVVSKTLDISLSEHGNRLEIKDITDLDKVAEAKAEARAKVAEENGGGFVELMATSRRYFEKVADSDEIIMRKREEMEKAAAADDDSYALVTTNIDGTKERFLRIDTPENFKTAQSTFDSQVSEIDPRYRVKIATKMRRVAEDCHWKIASKNVELYSPKAFNEKIAMNLNMRKDYIIDDTNKAVLDLMIKKASTTWSPAQFAEELTRFDEVNKLEKFWGTAFPDPYASIASVEKVANVAGYDITEEELMALAQDPSKLNGVLDASMIKDFSTNPVEFFNALPKPHQQMLVGLIQGHM